MLLSRQMRFVAANVAALVAVLSQPSCNIVFREAPAGSDAVSGDAILDGIPATPRLALPFGNAQSTTIAGEDPSVSDDGLHLWHVNVTTVTDRDVVYKERISTGELFADSASPLNINTQANEVNADISADQLQISYASTFNVPGNGLYAIYEARRQDRENDFGTPKLTNILMPSNPKDFEVSLDTNQFFVIADGMLKSYKRNTRDELYADGPTATLPNALVSSFTVSFDRLELVYARDDGRQLMRSLLSADGSEYGAPQRFDVGKTCAKFADPDFSPNAMTLTFSCEGTIYIATRPPL